MKKVKLFICLYMISLFNIGIVRADMGMPNLNEVDAIVNIDNITVETSDGTITFKKGDKIKVGKFGKDYYYKYYKININDNDIIINSSDYDILDATKLVNKEKIIILASNGMKMYKGPSDLYDEVTTIPKGEIVELEYVSDNLNYSTYSYGEYNGQKGWIDTYTHTLGREWSDATIAYVESGTIYTIKDSIYVYSLPLRTSFETVKKVELNKEYNYSYYLLDARTRWFYVEELGGWVKDYISYPMGNSTESYLNKTINKVLVVSKELVPVYKSYDSMEKLNVKLSGPVVLNYSYKYEYYDKWEYRYYVNIDGIYGWISSLDAKISTSYLGNSSYMYVGANSLKKFDSYNLSEYNSMISKYDIINAYSYDVEDSKCVRYYTDNNEWVEDCNNNLISLDEQYINLRSNIYVYKDMDTNSDKIGIIKGNAHVKSLYTVDDKEKNIYWMYIEYGDKYGWIKVQRLLDGDLYDRYYYKSFDYVSDYEVEMVEKENNIEIIQEDNNEIMNENNELDNNVYYYIGIAVAVSLAALVTIIIINKKKKSKVHDKDEESTIK